MSTSLSFLFHYETFRPVLWLNILVLAFCLKFSLLAFFLVLLEYLHLSFVTNVKCQVLLDSTSLFQEELVAVSCI